MAEWIGLPTLNQKVPGLSPSRGGFQVMIVGYFIAYAIFNDQSFNDTLNNDTVSFEQLGPEIIESAIKLRKGSSNRLHFSFFMIILMSFTFHLLLSLGILGKNFSR